MIKKCTRSADCLLMHSWSLIHVPHIYLTNGSPIHCQHTTDAIMTKTKKTNRKTPLGQYNYWLIPRLTKDRYSNRYINVQSTKMSAWFIGQISADTAYKTSDPWFISYIFYGISLLWKGKKCSYLILGTLKPGMAKTNDKPVVQRRLQEILPVQPTSSKLISSLMAYSMILSQHKSNMYRFKVASSVKYF